MEAKHTPRAAFVSGHSAPWIAEVNGQPVRNNRGEVRRFNTREAAEQAARAAAGPSPTPDERA